MLINYRHYKTEAMLAILTREGVYYSRGSFVDRGRAHKPDTVSLRVAENAGRLGGTLVIECEVFNNLEGNEDILRERGFVREEGAGKHYKRRTVAFQYKMDAGSLVKTVLAGLEAAAADMPLLTYVSPALKALADYHDFMTANIAKIGYEDLLRHLGYRTEDDFPWEEWEAGPEYLVAKYKRGLWAAWVGGDLIIPLFASEIEAMLFLKSRALRVSRQRPVIRTIPAVNAGSSHPYILVDRTRNVDERVAWLRSELSRLEREREVI